MPETTERVLRFAKDAYIDFVGDLYNDPSILFEESEDAPEEQLAEFRQLGEDLGLDMDEVAKEAGCTEVEIERIADIEKGKGMKAAEPDEEE